MSATVTAEHERVMIDLETLGLDPGATILSIGAVRFNAEGLGETFHESISLESCEEAGLTIDAGTLDWWLQQDESVKGVLTGGVNLEKVLAEFSAFYGDATEIWAFSPSFDCEILSHAYQAVEIVKPWTYRDERCCRTLVSLPIAAEVDRDGPEHDALADAIYQAKTVSKTLERMDR